MLTEQEKYIIIDTLNEQLQAIICKLDPNPFENITIAELDTLLLPLPQTRIDQLRSIAQSLITAENTTTTEAISGKRRLIKADVLEWSDKAELGSIRERGELRSSLAARLRLILGLKSIAYLMSEAFPGQSQSSTQARLYRG